MDLSPNDIRGYEFRSQMRGYDKDEVDNFLDQVASALEETKQQNLKLSMELESMKAQLASLKQFEDTIKSAAIDARRNADMTVATAKQEAEMMLSKAKQQAEDILAKRAQDLSELEAKITRLGLTKKSYLSKIHSMIQSHLEMIDEVDSGEVQTDDVQTGEELSDTDDKIAVTESTDIKTGKRETVAQQPPEPAEEEAEEEEEEAAEDVTDSETADEAAAGLAADLQDAIQDEPADQPTEQAIDPELAAALESYKKMTAQKAAEEKHRPQPEIPPPPPQGVIVETTARAEDVPHGFIAKESGQEEDHSTDKVRMGQGDSSASMEPNSLDGFKSPENAKAPLPPEKLAEELDEVAARFAEEMDKAAKS